LHVCKYVYWLFLDFPFPFFFSHIGEGNNTMSESSIFYLGRLGY